MPIRRKSSIYKKYYESIGQGLLFGHDNLNFKSVNLPKKQNGNSAEGNNNASAAKQQSKKNGNWKKKNGKQRKQSKTGNHK